MRFFIRKEPRGDRWRWTLRDGVCAAAEHHDFDNPYWTDDCKGECDIFVYFASAIGKVSEIVRSGR